MHVAQVSTVDLASVLHKQKYKDSLFPSKSTVPTVGSYKKVIFPAFSTHGPIKFVQGKQESLHAEGTILFTVSVNDAVLPKANNNDNMMHKKYMLTELTKFTILQINKLQDHKSC